MIADALRKSTFATAREKRLFHGQPMTDVPAQLQALETAVTALAAAGIAHALIGGLAVGALSGVPRATLDVDLAVPTTVSVERLAAVLVAAGFRATGSFAHSLNFRSGADEPVQLAFDPEFDAMIERASKVSMGSFEVSIVQLADLIRMKRRAAGDPSRRRSKALRDQADIELLLGDTPDPDEGW